MRYQNPLGATASIYPPSFPFEPKFVTVCGYRIAYLDEGQGESTILMIHGNPVSGYVYERVMRLLVDDFRCVVPDLLGFGMSEKPADEKAYSLQKHIDIMTAFVQELELRQVVLVVHDWGGPIGLGAAVTEPSRYSHLILLNTMTEAPMKIMPVYWLPFNILLRWPRLFSYLVKKLNLFQRLGVGIMTESDQTVYFSANHSPDTRAGIAVFPRLIPASTRHPNYPLLRDILEKITAWPIPTLVLFSDHDSVFSAEQGERFAEKMVDARFKLISGPKHFLQYEQPDWVALTIKEFLD